MIISNLRSFVLSTSGLKYFAIFFLLGILTNVFGDNEINASEISLVARILSVLSKLLVGTGYFLWVWIIGHWVAGAQFYALYKPFSILFFRFCIFWLMIAYVILMLLEIISWQTKDLPGVLLALFFIFASVGVFLYFYLAAMVAKGLSQADGRISLP
jgi:hypothetical protein